MSKKTRKEKLASDQRRIQSLNQYNLSTVSVASPVSGAEIANKSKTYSLSVNPNNASATVQNNYSYVTSDLKRILLLTALAFCAQLVLWYFLGNKI